MIGQKTLSHKGLVILLGFVLTNSLTHHDKQLLMGQKTNRNGALGGT